MHIHKCRGRENHTAKSKVAGVLYSVRQQILPLQLTTPLRDETAHLFDLCQPYSSVPAIECRN